MLTDKLHLDITIFSDFDARAAAGNFLQVPLLAGSNKDEGDNAIVGEQLVTPGYTIPVLTEMISDIRGQASQFMDEREWVHKSLHFIA